MVGPGIQYSTENINHSFLRMLCGGLGLVNVQDTRSGSRDRPSYVRKMPQKIIGTLACLEKAKTRWLLACISRTSVPEFDSKRPTRGNHQHTGIKRHVILSFITKRHWLVHPRGI